MEVVKIFPVSLELAKVMLFFKKIEYECRVKDR